MRSVSGPYIKAAGRRRARVNTSPAFLQRASYSAARRHERRLCSANRSTVVGSRRSPSRSVFVFFFFFPVVVRRGRRVCTRRHDSRRCRPIAIIIARTMTGAAKRLVFMAMVLWARASEALPVFQEEYDYDSHHHAPPPATSYATISTTHVKVQHPPATYPKYESSPYKYQYVQSEQPRTAYKYISLSEALALQQQANGGGGGGGGGKYEEPSTPGYKYLAASPTYKYVQPPAVTTEPEAAEEPTNSLKYALKYEQNPQHEHEQPAVRYKYVAVPSYEYAQQQQAAVPEYGQHRHRLQAAASSYDFGDDDDKQQY